MTIKYKAYKKFTGSYWFKFHAMDSEGAKERKRGFRSWLAWAVRSIADKIDGADSMTIEVQSIPVIPMAERSALIKRGLTHSRNLFVELVKHESTNEAMREHLPELYSEDAK